MYGDYEFNDDDDDDEGEHTKANYEQVKSKEIIVIKVGEKNYSSRIDDRRLFAQYPTTHNV